MSDYSINILAEAELDLEETIEWYESQKKDLGYEFALAYYDAEELIAQNPHLYQQVTLHFRRALVNRFPYSIFYEIIEDAKEVNVIAILHQRRSVQTIKKKLKLL